MMERYAWEVTKMAGMIKSNPGLVHSAAGQGVTGRLDFLVIILKKHRVKIPYIILVKYINTNHS